MSSSQSTVSIEQLMDCTSQQLTKLEKTTASQTTQAADTIEQQSEGRWTPPEEGDLVLLR